MESVWAFVAVSLLVIATPGPDTALTVRNTLVGGRHGGCFTALGAAAGQAIWALGTSGDYLRRGSIGRLIEAATGAALVALGLRLASEQR